MNLIKDQKLEVTKARDCLVWVAVVSKPFQEMRAKRELLNQRVDFGETFEVYLPMKLSMNRKRELVAAPFFPRYLFARIDLRLESWKRIWSTLGVHGLVGANMDRPCGIADWVIEMIQAHEDAGFIRMGLPHEQAKSLGKSLGLSAGERVRVAGSPLEAVFVEMVDDRRAAILVSLLGRDSTITVDVAKLRSMATD